MADRSSLKFVGFIFATVTLAVMLTAGMVVKGYADGVYTLEDTAFARRVVQDSLTIARDRAASSAAANQRLQISASTTTATTSSPTKRIMIVPMPATIGRNGIGSVLSG